MKKKCFMILIGILFLFLTISYAATLPYWIESTNSGYNLWFKIPEIRANATQIVYIKKDGSYSPNGNNVFVFFDDFNKNISKSEFNSLSKWNSVDSWAGYDTTCKNYPYQRNVVLVVRTDQGWGGLRITAKKFLKIDNLEITARVYCDKTINSNPDIGVGFSSKSPIRRIGNWKTNAKLSGVSYYKSMADRRPSTGNYYTISYFRRNTVNMYPYIWNWDGEYHFLYVYVRKHADKPLNIMLGKVKGGVYKVTLYNPNDYDLENFQVEVSKPPFINSSDEGLKISESNSTSTKEIFYDDFSNGMKGLRLFGSPKPRIVNVHGKDHVFDNMGDSWCNSGAITEKSYDLSKGAVITAEVYLDVFNPSDPYPWNTIIIGSSNGEYYQSGCCADDGMQVTSFLYFDMEPNYDNKAYLFGYGMKRHSFMAERYINGWHILKAVIQPTGYEKVYIDNTYVGEGKTPIPVNDLKNIHLYLGARSSGEGGKAYIAWVKVTSYEVENQTEVPASNEKNSPQIEVKIGSPANGTHFSTGQITIKGVVKNFNGSTATLYLNGLKRVIGINKGSFNYSFVLEPGTNVIKVEAKKGKVVSSDQITVYYDTSTKEALWIELTWNQNHSDVDLYVYEPNGNVVWYHNKHGLGVLDHDVTTGYGPEHYTLLSSNVIPGKYRIRVHYYDTHGQTNPVTCHVIVKKYGVTVIDQKFILTHADSNNANPSSNGSDWHNVGNAVLEANNTYSVSGYVKDKNGNPLKDVKIIFSNGRIITTNSKGYWKINLSEKSVTAKASKAGWKFAPSVVYVNNSVKNITFIGTREASSPAVECFGTVVLNGKIYVVGGWNNGALRNVEVYDPKTNNWRKITSMPTARFRLGVVSLNGKIYAIGGENSSGRPLKTVEVYDPNSNSWAEAAPLPTARAGLEAVALNGKIYVIGGGDVNGNLVKSVAVYNPRMNKWLTEPRKIGTNSSIKSKKFVAGVLKIEDDKFYVIYNGNKLSVPATTKVEMITVKNVGTVENLVDLIKNLSNNAWGILSRFNCETVTYSLKKMRKFSGINVYFNLEKNEVGSTKVKDLKILVVYVGKLVSFETSTHRIYTQLFVDPFYYEPNVPVKFEGNEPRVRDGSKILMNVVMWLQFKLVTSKNNVQEPIVTYIIAKVIK